MSKLVVEAIENSAGTNPLSVLMTEQTTTSGNTVDITGIPEGVKKITVVGESISTDATGNNLIIQLGDAGGIETTGYSVTNSQSTSNYTLTSGAGLIGANLVAAGTYDFLLELMLMNTSHKWVMEGSGRRSDSSQTTASFLGTKTLSASLDRIRLTIDSVGSHDFDNGNINARYEY